MVLALKNVIGGVALGAYNERVVYETFAQRFDGRDRPLEVEPLGNRKKFFVGHDYALSLMFMSYPSTTSPKNSGQWKFGAGRSMGDQLRKWGSSHLSPHL